MLAYHAVCCLMQAAAAALDSDDLSFTHAVQVVRHPAESGPTVSPVPRLDPGRGLSCPLNQQYWA